MSFESLPDAGRSALLPTILRRVKKVIGKVASSLSGRAFSGLRAPGLLILPADPGSIIGSRGDQAMLEVMIQHWRALHPRGRIGISTANDAADDIVFSLGAMPERIYMVPLDRALGCCRRYGNVQVMGADVMDGAYSPESSAFLGGWLRTVTRPGSTFGSSDAASTIAFTHQSAHCCCSLSFPFPSAFAIRAPF